MRKSSRGLETTVFGWAARAVLVLALIHCGGANGEKEVRRTSSALGAGWQALGPFGSSIPGGPAMWTGAATEVEENPSSGVYRLATWGSGLFEWNGSSWVSLTNSLVPVNPTQPASNEGMSATTLATRPGSPDTVVFGTAARSPGGGCCSPMSEGTSGIWLTTNRGATWTQVLAPPSAGDVYRVRWSNANWVHAATSTGYWVSQSAGARWAHILWSNTTNPYTDLVVSPSDPNVIYVASAGMGLQRVTWSPPPPNGKGWTHAQKTVVTDTSTVRSVVAISLVQPDVVYYMHCDAAGAALWRLNTTPSDSAAPVTSFPTSQAGETCYAHLALGVNPINPNVLIAGVNNIVQSADGGNNWNPVDQGWGGIHGDISGVTWDQFGNTLAVTDGGYFYSSDNGLTWNSASNTAPMISLEDFDLQPRWGWMMGAAWDTGVSVSSNMGQSWSISQNIVGDGLYMLADTDSPQRFWTVNAEYCPARTDDGGANWASVDIVPSVPCSNVGPLAHDRVPPVDLYAASNVSPAWNVNATGTILQGPAVYRSHDLGQTWAPLAGNIPQDQVFSFAVGTYQNPLAGTGQPGSWTYVITGAYRARDSIFVNGAGQADWFDITPFGETSADAPVVVTHPGWDTASAQTAWVLFNGPPRVFVTTNAGGQAPPITTDGWTNITGDLPSSVFHLTDIAVDPATGSLYLATSAGVYKTTNNGTNWVQWTTGLPVSGSQWINRLRTSDQGPQGNFTVYAGAWGSGVWWRNGGE